MKKPNSDSGKPSHRKKKQIVLVGVVLFFFMSSSSWAWRKEYKEAGKFMKVGAYEQAIEQLEKALAPQDLKAKTKTPG